MNPTSCDTIASGPDSFSRRCIFQQLPFAFDNIAIQTENTVYFPYIDSNCDFES